MWNKKFEPEESGSDKRQKGTSVPSRPILLALNDDFGTIDWAAEYPYPAIALRELQELLQ